MKRFLKILAIVVAGVLALLILIGAAFVWMIGQALDPGPETRVSAYSSLLKDWSEMGVVDGFPKTIPANATDVSLHARPGILQGSGHFQLRMKLPPADVAAIEARAKAAAVRTCPPQCTDYIEEPEFWSVPWLHAGETESGRFPSDFVVYALETDGDWNHPTGEGVAVSRARNEVIYWADD